MISWTSFASFKSHRIEKSAITPTAPKPATTYPAWNDRDNRQLVLHLIKCSWSIGNERGGGMCAAKHLYLFERIVSVSSPCEDVWGILGVVWNALQYSSNETMTLHIQQPTFHSLRVGGIVSYEAFHIDMKSSSKTGLYNTYNNYSALVDMGKWWVGV